MRHSKDWANLNDKKKEEGGGTQGGLASPGSGEAGRSLHHGRPPDHELAAAAARLTPPVTVTVGHAICMDMRIDGRGLASRSRCPALHSSCVCVCVCACACACVCVKCRLVSKHLPAPPSQAPHDPLYARTRAPSHWQANVCVCVCVCVCVHVYIHIHIDR